MQSLAQEMGIIFMGGLTHSNDTTGKDRRRYGFRHFFNAYMSGQALGPVLAKEIGKDRRAYHLTADYTWGWTQEESIKNATEKLGWKTVAAVRTPLGAGDFSQYITPVLNSGADVLILNHYGKDMVNSLTQAVQFGLRDKQVNGKKFEIVVPLFSRLMAQGAGDAVKGILGTANWHWTLDDEATKAFAKSFGDEFGMPPSQAAHTCYVQALLYANACERAGTFYPPEVIKALEGFKFDGMGNGPTEYRAADHQCFKDVLVVRGKEKPTNKFDLLEVVKVVPRKEVEYDPKIFGGELGPYTRSDPASATALLAASRVRLPRRHGRDPAATAERPRQGRRLCADRARPDADLRHARRGQLRPRRAVHARRLLRRDVAQAARRSRSR